jgi:hypothetical protein
MTHRSKHGRSRRFAWLLAVCSCALALLAPAAAARRYALDATLGAAESLFGGRVPARTLLQEARVHGHRGRGRELTPVLAELAVRLKTLTGAERLEAARLLARPTDDAADPQQNGYSAPEARNSPFCSAHFCIHWVSSGGDAPALTDANGNGIPDYVETVDATAENVYAVENGQLGWRAPKADGRLGGGVNLTDIYLKNLGGTGIYGYTAPDPGQLAGRGGSPSLYAYLVLDNSFDATKFPHYATPRDPLDVTLAHEYNHVLQFNYDALEDTWMFESTAVWMESKVYPAVHDYFQYLPGWVSLTQAPITRFDGTDPNDRSNVKVYGSSVWNKWLDARYGQEVVRGAWEASTSTRPASFAPAAYNVSLRAHGGQSFYDGFSRFSAATAEWQAQNSGFPEGGAYPDVRRVGTLAPNSAGGLVRLAHTTFAMINVAPTAAPRIKLVVTAPPRVESAIALVGRTGPASGGVQTTQLVELPRGGRSAVTLDAPGAFTRLTAVVVNADSSERGYSPSAGDWLFTKDNEPYVVRVTTDFTSPRLRRRAPRAGARNVSVRPAISIAFTKPVYGVSGHSIRLIGPGGRAVRVRIRFRAGSRAVTLLPVGRLRRGGRYRVEVRSTITDANLNPLAAATWSFSTGR